MTFELLQPVTYRRTIGYISSISDRYLTICFVDRPDPTQRWGRYQANLVVYREYWNEIRCGLPETEKEQAIAPRSSFLQLGRRELVGATH